jgi:hypothetical protein
MQHKSAKSAQFFKSAKAAFNVAHAGSCQLNASEMLHKLPKAASTPAK